MATRSVEHAERLLPREQWNRLGIFTVEEGNTREVYKIMTIMENIKLPFHHITAKVSIK